MRPQRSKWRPDLKSLENSVQDINLLAMAIAGWNNLSNILSKLTLLGPKYAATTTTALILYLLFYMIILLHNKTGFWVFFLQLTTPPPNLPLQLLQYLFLLLLFVHFFATCCLFVISSKNRNMIIINMIRGKIVLFDFLGELTKLHIVLQT